ncbi:YceI family protein [Methylibium sp.]|uniref:YceI family protein n=1 Tax=Methylibium sp. TaxID=2067992 RepID=UPI003D137B89
MRVLSISLLLGLSAVAQAEPVRYTLDPAHSWVQFELSHFGTSTIRGRFGPAEGSVSLDRTAGQGEVGVTVPTGSVSTGSAMFDSHLRQAELLSTGEHPTAWFVSRQLRFDGDRLGELRGEFTLRGVSRGLTLTATRFACYRHPVWQREVCGGDFEGRFKRSDFGIDYGLPFVRDEVTLRVQVEGVRTDDGPPTH